MNKFKRYKFEFISNFETNTVNFEITDGINIINVPVDVEGTKKASSFFEGYIVPFIIRLDFMSAAKEFHEEFNNKELNEHDGKGSEK